MANTIEMTIAIFVCLIGVLAYFTNTIIQHAAIGKPMFVKFNSTEQHMWDVIKQEYDNEFASKSYLISQQTALDRLRNTHNQRNNQLIELNYLRNQSLIWDNNYTRQWQAELRDLKKQESKLIADKNELERLKYVERERQANQKELLYLREKNITHVQKDINVKIELENLRSQDKQRNNTIKEVKQLKNLDNELSENLTRLIAKNRETKKDIDKMTIQQQYLFNNYSQLQREERTLFSELSNFKDYVNELKSLKQKYSQNILNVTTQDFYNNIYHMISTNLTVQHCLFNQCKYKYDLIDKFNYINNCIDESKVNLVNLNDIIKNLQYYSDFKTIKSGLLGDYKLKTNYYNDSEVVLYLEI